MNNKMKLENFLNAGGQVEIWLWPSLRHLGINLFFAANSVESAKEIAREIEQILFEMEWKFHKNLKEEQLYERIFFRWHGIEYKPDNDWSSITKALINLEGAFGSYYLHAEGRVYGNW